MPEPATAVTPQPGEGPFDFVARHADAHHRVWVVAPETDGLLEHFQRAIDPARWLGCDRPSIKLAAGKRRTLMALADAGVTTPLAFEHEPEITRWVVKPDDGAGALDTRLHASPAAACEDWSQRSRPGHPMAIEPWVEGPALSLSLMCSPGHTELLSVNGQHLAIDAEGWLSHEGMRGPVLIEVNPRVTCAYVGLSQALRHNLAAEVIAACGRPAGRVGRADV